MKRRIRLTESDLHRIVSEAARRVISEGFASPMLKNLARKHGGVEWVNKDYQLDKLNDVSSWGDFFELDSRRADLPSPLSRLIER
jgi:hypothetical protein